MTKQSVSIPFGRAHFRQLTSNQIASEGGRQILRSNIYWETNSKLALALGKTISGYMQDCIGLCFFMTCKRPKLTSM